MVSLILVILEFGLYGRFCTSVFLLIVRFSGLCG